MNEEPLPFSSPDEKLEFKSPDHYFETFSSRLHDRLNAAAPKPFRKAWVLAPLAVVAIAVIFLLFKPEPKSLNTSANEEQLIDQLLQNSYLSSIDGELMADVFSEELASLDIYQSSQADTFLLENLEVNELIYDYEI